MKTATLFNPNFTAIKATAISNGDVLSIENKFRPE
jgi:hypothetical protein